MNRFSRGGALFFTALLFAAPQAARAEPFPGATYRIDAVSRIAPGTYRIDSDDLGFLVLAPDASQLAALANFDALSEDWSCRFVPVPGQRTHIATECKQTP